MAARTVLGRLLFLKWLGVTERSLQFVMDRHRNKSYWSQPEFGMWKFNGWSAKQVSDSSSSYSHSTFEEKFHANRLLEYDREAKYIIVGKGYP